MQSVQEVIHYKRLTPAPFYILLLLLTTTVLLILRIISTYFVVLYFCVLPAWKLTLHTQSNNDTHYEEVNKNGVRTILAGEMAAAFPRGRSELKLL